MAVIDDQGVRRSRVCGATSPPRVPQRVIRLRPRPVRVELAEHLPLAVGFGSTIDLPPCRLWAVPGSGTDVVPLPAALDEGWQDGVRPRLFLRPVGLEPGAGSRGLDRAAVDSGAAMTASNPVTLREPAPLQLTARGRVVLLLLAAAVGVVVVVFAWFGAGSSTVAAPAAQPTRITVHAGDTLWSIAGKVAPNHDPRAVVARLLELNHLHSPDLVPGQVLLTR